MSPRILTPLVVLVFVALARSQAVPPGSASPGRSTPGSAHYLFGLSSKVFTLDEDDLPDSIDDDRPITLLIRTDFTGVVRFVDADDFLIEMTASGSENLTRPIKQIVDYSMVDINSTEQTVLLQVLERPEVSAVSTLLTQIGMAVGLSTGVVLLAVILFAVLYYRRRKRREREEGEESEEEEIEPQADADTSTFGVKLKNKQTGRGNAPQVEPNSDPIEVIGSSNVNEKSQAESKKGKRTKRSKVTRNDDINNETKKQKKGKGHEKDEVVSTENTKSKEENVSKKDVQDTSTLDDSPNNGNSFGVKLKKTRWSPTTDNPQQSNENTPNKLEDLNKQKGMTDTRKDSLDDKQSQGTSKNTTAKDIAKTKKKESKMKKMSKSDEIMEGTEEPIEDSPFPPKGGRDIDSRAKKGGGTGKKSYTGLSITSLAVICCACVTLPVVVHSLSDQTVQVDITLHIPKDFLDQGVQIFFFHEREIQIVTNGWENKVPVTEFAVERRAEGINHEAVYNCSLQDCQHGCDLSVGQCVCFKGYNLVNGTECHDIDECDVSSSRCDVNATCINNPGYYDCECDYGFYGDGFTCRDCDLPCPNGTFEQSGCSRNKGKVCIDCTPECPTDMYISSECTETSDIRCTECADPCDVTEYEAVACGGSTNKDCRALTELYPIRTSNNTITEDLREVTSQATDVMVEINPGYLDGTEIEFHRGSGYTVQVKIIDLALRPLYVSVDHSSGYDPGAPTIDWCEYPYPEYYRLDPWTFKNVTTLTEIHNGQYVRSADTPCNTSQGDTVGKPPKYHLPNTIRCTEQCSLSELFNSSHKLENHTSIMLDKTEGCANLSQQCEQCSSDCARSFNTSEAKPPCQLPTEAELTADMDNVIERMKECLRCCVLKKCSSCAEYQREPRCRDKIRCRTGNIIEFHLEPVFRYKQFCHVQPKTGSRLYHMEYQVFYEREQVENRTFTAERFVKDRQKTGRIRSTNRHNFLLVRQSSGLSEVVEHVRMQGNEIEAGKQTFSSRPGPLTLTSPGLIVPYKPFGINTKTWKNQPCDLSISGHFTKRESSTFQPYSDVEVLKKDSGVLINSKTQNSSIQIILPQRLSLLQAFFNEISVKNDRTLRAKLLRNQTLWTVRVQGQINPCPGMLNFRIRAPEYDNVTLFHFDVGIHCPENFSVEFYLPTEGPDIHDKRLILEIKDSHRLVSITLFRPAGSQKYNFKTPNSFKFNFNDFLLRLVPFFIGTGAMVVALILILIFGYCTRPDPLHTGRDNRFHKRHLMFVVWFVVFKFAYSMLVTITEFMLITKAIHSSTLGVIEQYPEYHRLVAKYEQIELGKIKTHLDTELERQENDALLMKRVCDNHMKVMQARVDDARRNLFKIYYSTVKQFDITGIASEKLDRIIKEFNEKLEYFQEDFNRFGRNTARKMKAKMQGIYNDVKNHVLLIPAKILRGVLNALCFRKCMPPLMKFVGLDFDVNGLPSPNLHLALPKPNLTNILKLDVPGIDIDLPSFDGSSVINRDLLKDPSFDDLNYDIDIKQYVPNPEFNFFLNLLRENYLLILLLVLDGIWFAFRMSRTYATVVQLIHGFPVIINVEEEQRKLKSKNGENISRSEKVRASVQAGVANLTDRIMDLGLRMFELLKEINYRVTNTDLVPQILLVAFLLTSVYLIIIVTQNLLDVESLWVLGFFNLKVAPILKSRKVANTRIVANAFKINNLDFKFYEAMYSLRVKKYKTLLSMYNRLMCEKTSFQAAEYCAWWEEVHPREPCEPPVIQRIQVDFTTCDIAPIDPIKYTDFDSLAYRLELKRSMEPYVAAIQTTILNSFIAFAAIIGVLVIIGIFKSAIMVLLKRFDMVRLLKIYHLQDDPTMLDEYLPECLREDHLQGSAINPEAEDDMDAPSTSGTAAPARAKKISAVAINKELFGERTHECASAFVQHKKRIA